MVSRRERTPRTGPLVVIGGGEDRESRKVVLRRFIELAGGSAAEIAVLTAASNEPEALWDAYDEAFSDLGVRKHFPVHLQEREQANDPELCERITRSNAVFMTGGDQKRLLALVGGTALDFAMHRAHHEQGLCIAGTSAGASAISEHMLAEGAAYLRPQKGMALLSAGLGFLQRVVIDQHFSERQRLSRLLTIVAQNPYLLGVGIDEDTALVVERGKCFEIVGAGAVTIIDGSQLHSNFLDADDRDHLELINVRLHLLPAGRSYHLHPGKSDAGELPSPQSALHDVINAITGKAPHENS